MPYVSARSMAAAVTNDRLEGSDASKVRARGKRLGADQKGVPEEVTASSGKVNVSCLMRLEK